MPTSTTVFFSLYATPAQSRLFIVPNVNGVISPKMPYIKTTKRHQIAQRTAQEADTVIRFIKILFYLFILLAALVVGYAYLGDLSPATEEVVEPVTLDEG